MADTNDRVMAMVEKELQADPEISNEDLRAKAEKLDEGVTRMSARQFNARYPLQVKRRLRPRRSGGPKSARGAAGGKRAGKGRGAKRGRPAGAGRKAGRPAAAKSARAARGGQGDGTRGRVRATMLDFARDLASADGAGLVDVIAGVDGYVDRVLEATGRS